jgi:hypothetical protein
MIVISNNGSDIIETNYFDTERAQQGLFYLTANAGVWRLLVPDSQLSRLADMKTGHMVSIEDSILQDKLNRKCVDIVFDDGTPAPFAITLDSQQIDRRLQCFRTKLTAWTRNGCVGEWPCVVVANVESNVPPSANVKHVLIY